jgi:hypothetical protein
MFEKFSCPPSTSPKAANPKRDLNEEPSKNDGLQSTSVPFRIHSEMNRTLAATRTAPLGRGKGVGEYHKDKHMYPRHHRSYHQREYRGKFGICHLLALSEAIKRVKTCLRIPSMYQVDMIMYRIHRSHHPSVTVRDATLPQRYPFGCKS